jgi:hypothetical protein
MSASTGMAIVDKSRERRRLGKFICRVVKLKEGICS